MLLIGLTGGIGSGKSTVCQLFAQLGVPIIDTDTIAHALVEPGQPALKQLEAIFGHEIIDQQGHLDRAILRERVFSDASERQRLESILHPLIRSKMQRELKMLRASYVIIAIPLLLEKGWQNEADRILVVDTDESLQIERTIKRDGISADEVKRIMQTQVSRQQRIDAADDIIHNDGKREALKAQVLNLHQHYLQLADSSSHG